MSRSRSWWMVVVAALAVSVAACSSTPSLKGGVVKDAAPCRPSVEATTTAPKLAKPASIPKTLVKKDLKVVAKGCAAAKNTYLKVQYVGILAKTGRQFVSSWQSGKPLEFLLGTSRVIQGWETGLSGMKVGGRRQLTVPAALAYGKAGLASEGIGPDEPLEFVIDMLSVEDHPTVCNPGPIPAAPGKPTNVTLPTTPPKTLKQTNLTVGTGATAKAKSYVKVQIYGISCTSGGQIFSSWDEKPAAPINAVLGTPTSADQAANISSLVPGVTTGVEGMKVGGVRQLDIPSDQAYGAQGQPPDIGPNDPLTFVVQLLAVSSKPPAAATTTTTVAPGSTTTTTGGSGSSSTTTSAPAGSTTTTASPGSSTTTTGSTTSTTTTR